MYCRELNCWQKTICALHYKDDLLLEELLLKPRREIMNHILVDCLHEHFQIQIKHLQTLCEKTQLEIEKEIESVAKTPKHIAYLKMKLPRALLLKHGSVKLAQLCDDLTEYQVNAQSYMHDDKLVQEARQDDKMEKLVQRLFNSGMMFASRCRQENQDLPKICSVQ